MMSDTETRIRGIEDAVAALGELVRHLGQELSWSPAGARLNNPPPYIRDAQRRFEEWHRDVELHRLSADNREDDEQERIMIGDGS